MKKDLSNLIRLYRKDILIIAILAIVAATSSFKVASLIDPVIYGYEASDVWFEADISRVFRNMTGRKSNHYRTKVHPLFSLTAYPPTKVIQKLFNFTAIKSVKIVIAIVSSLWITALFIVLRLLGCLRLDALLFSCLAMTSAAMMFWFTVPETYSFGSLTILIALVMAAIAQRVNVPQWLYIPTSALTLSSTTTNWMVGLFTTFINLPWKRALQISINAFCVVVLLWGIQKLIFPTAEFFIGDREEKNYLFQSASGGPWYIILSFIFHTIVMPAIDIVDKFNRPEWPVMTTQLSAPGSGTIWGTIAVGLWASLLALGLWALLKLKHLSKFRNIILLALLGQLALHLVYGDETFLYSAHFLPLFLVLASTSTLTRFRPAALVLVGLLTIFAGINNTIQFNKTIDFFSSHGSPRHQVLSQMHLRPSDPWPRGVGHTVLGIPGSSERDKAYHEPGGSFSPAVGSFGISFWLTDAGGNLKFTSDDIPLNEIDQSFVWNDGQTRIPSILSETDYYQARWTHQSPGHFDLLFKPKRDGHHFPLFTLRSVGPAGGAIHALNWDGKTLLVNDRWQIHIAPTPTKVQLGTEGQPGWLTENRNVTKWKEDDAWGYARVQLDDSHEWKIDIEDLLNKAARPEIDVTTIQPPLLLDLPSEVFTSSLNAQIAHLMMGLVGNETRPGEPTNYPLSWLRDGAYILVALARAGQLELAKELSTHFVDNDFFGGFGSEADAPGLAIWALEEVAVRVKQPQYDQWLWPHIRRKSEYIVDMMHTDRPIYKPFIGDIVPSERKKTDLTLVADAAREGLIIGKMDQHRPLLFVNAVSYLGLQKAASIAERMQKPAEAERWRMKAEDLQQAWEKAFKPPESNNNRTYISSLWPTWVATTAKDTLLQNLQRRWQERRDARGGFKKTPLWTYFDVAEAHQWLLLKRPDRAWATLRWFWDNQVSPGLYGWWEGSGEENTFGLWERVRGWVSPPHVTPHYWTAAEMLLLQLDMLVYIDESASEPVLMIGAGIPKEWLDQPMRVQGIFTTIGQVDWVWKNRGMHVTIHSKSSKMKVQLGEAFPEYTKTIIKYTN